jgi:ketosteroid isomerase-like protein
LVPPALAPAIEHWRAAVLAGNAAALKNFYDPAAQMQDVKKQPISLADELQFWTAAKKAGLQTLKLDVVKVEQQNGLEYVKFQAELRERSAGRARTQYVVANQAWKAGPAPRIVGEMRTDMLRLKQPVRLNPKLYDPAIDARAEIRDTEQRAAREHKRVLLVFGGNWCYDCHVLDLAFHSGDIEPTLDRSYLIVHVDVGEYNKNLDLADKYQVPLQKGVPAIAVVDPADKLIFSQQAGEFEKARSMTPEEILAFLNKWKPPARPR